MKENGAILQPVSHGYRYVYTLSTKTAPNHLPPLGVPCIFNLTEMRCNQWRMPCNIICGCACGSLHANIRLDFQRIANSIRTNYTVVVLASVTSIDLSCILFRIFESFTTHTHTTTRSRISSIFWCIAKWWWQTIWWESANENLTLGWWNIHFRWSV